MIYNKLKQKNEFTKRSINRHTNLKVKIEKIQSSITFLIKCRNSGIIPNFIKNSMKKVYNILENQTESDYTLQRTLTNYIDNFQSKILNIIIKHKHNTKKVHNENKKHIEEILNKQLSQEEIEKMMFRENTITDKIRKKSNENHKNKYQKLMIRQRTDLGIKFNEKWFVNKTDTEFPDDVKWLLSLGQKHALHIPKPEFPLFKYIADAEDLVQSYKQKDEQERARTMFTTTIDNHINKMRENKREKFMRKTVEQTNNFLKKNKDVLILNADKGNVTVAMNKEEYKKRMLQIVGDIMIYQRINKDPTTSLQKKNNELVEELLKNRVISEQERKRLKTEIATAPRLYGLPKIHKEGYPLRPICSSINSPSMNLCKYIVGILKHLTQNSKYNVKDSVQFRYKIKDVTISDDEKLVSFDVVSLFPSIPVDLAVRIIEDRWQEITEFTNMNKSLFLKILKFCIMENRYFKYDDKIYKQKKGLPMGSPASPIVADIVMEKLLDTCMDNLTTKPRILTKYVDDIFAIVPESAIKTILTTLNSFHDNIKFTIEEEKNQQIPYLDTLVIRNNKRIEVDWYQKDTASGRIINYYSQHPKTIIINTAKNLINRVLTISDTRFHTKNKSKIKHILRNNNFPNNLINNLISNHRPANQHINQKDKDAKIFKSLTYVPGISERIANSDIVDKNKYKIAHKTNNTIKKLFSNTKSKIPMMETPNVIYKIPCGGNDLQKCQKVYVGTTKNKLKTRITGHKADLKTRSSSITQKTALSTHCANENHQPNFDNTRVLQRENNYHKRLTLEMLHINNVPTTKRINYKTDTENIAHIYKHLIRKREAVDRSAI